MSQWTHVNGSIRIDSIRMIGMKKVIPGNKKEWNKPKQTRYLFDVPSGSEGSLDFQLWTNPSRSSLAAYVLNIFGDLRDFGDEHIDSIEEYLNRVTEGHIVRSGIVEVEVEYGSTYIFIYNRNREKWVKTTREQTHDKAFIDGLLWDLESCFGWDDKSAEEQIEYFKTKAKEIKESLK